MKTIPTPFDYAIPVLYLLLSIIIIFPIYYEVPLVVPGVIKFFSYLGADLPTVTKLVLNVYKISFIFNLFVLLFAVWFFLENKKTGASIILFVFLNASLLLCIIWREFFNFSMLLPHMQLMSAS